MERSNPIVNKRWHIAGEVAYWMFLTLACAVFLAMNVYTTLKEDDFFHSMIVGSQGQPINNILDVLRSWWGHYLVGSARTSNLLDFTFNGLLGKTVFNICNMLVFGLMAHLVSHLTTHRNSITVLVMLFTYIVAAWPVPGETLLWVAGSCNYMWAMTATLLLIAYLLTPHNPRPGGIQATGILVFSMLAGASNEGTTLGVGAGLTLYCIINRRSVDRATLLVLAGYLAGCLLLLSCPSAWSRADNEVMRNVDFVTMITERCKLLLSKSIKYITPITAIIACIAAVTIKRLRKATFTPWAYLLVGLLAFLFVLGKNQERPYTTLALISFIIMVMALDYWIFKRSRWLQILVITTGLALIVWKLPYNLEQMKSYQQFYSQVEADIAQAPADQAVLKVPFFKGYSRFIKVVRLDSWGHFIHEQTLCYHYGKENLQFVPDDIYNRYHNGTLLNGAKPMPFISPDSGAVQQVLALPTLNCMAVQLRQDSIAHSYQFAQVSDANGQPLTPVSYFPLRYQNHVYIFFKMPNNAVSKLSFAALGIYRDPITLRRTAPNPVWTGGSDTNTAAD